MVPFKIILAGHGCTAPGKRNKYGYREWLYTRMVAAEWSRRLTERREPHVFINPGPCDIPLKTLVKTCDYYHDLHNGNAVVISLHTNAGNRDGSWHPANGVTTFYHSNTGKRLVDGFGAAYSKVTGIRNRGEKQAKFWNSVRKKWTYLYMTKNPKSVAALIEMFFHTNKNDVELGKDVNIVVDGLEAHPWTL